MIFFEGLIKVLPPWIVGGQFLGNHDLCRKERERARLAYIACDFEEFGRGNSRRTGYGSLHAELFVVLCNDCGLASRCLDDQHVRIDCLDLGKLGDNVGIACFKLLFDSYRGSGVPAYLASKNLHSHRAEVGRVMDHGDPFAAHILYCIFKDGRGVNHIVRCYMKDPFL